MKIKEGGGMDLQKEREAFEDHLKKMGKTDNETFSKNEDDSYQMDIIHFGWKIWQAAKAQADQKVKLLLCDDHLKKCESPTGIFNSQYPDEEPCLICLAKEAKAQAVPEGFVLVRKEPDADLVNHGHQVFLGHFNEGGQTGGRSLYFAYKAMIEAAQEPAND